jgi:hypothetical protein
LSGVFWLKPNDDLALTHFFRFYEWLLAAHPENKQPGSRFLPVQIQKPERNLKKREQYMLLSLITFHD